MPGVNHDDLDPFTQARRHVYSFHPQERRPPRRGFDFLRDSSSLMAV
jgi:hypothetical protein